jgi:hypothetical protein
VRGPLPSSTPALKGFASSGEDAGLSLCEEGESIGFLMFEWLKSVVVRRQDGSAVFSVHRRTAFTSHASLSGAFTGRIKRIGRTYVSSAATFTQAVSGVLTGPHGEIIVYDVPADTELIRLKFAPGATPEIRAAMIGIAVLYEHDFRR